MAGIRTVADGRMKVAILTTAPVDPKAPTATELAAGINSGPLLAKNGTSFGSTGSDTINDPRVSDASNQNVYGASNFGGTMAPYWFLDSATGAYVAADNEAYEALRVKNSEVYVYTREGPEEDVAWAAADVSNGYLFRTDDPKPGGESGSYIKKTITVSGQGWLDIAVAAGI